MISMNHQQNTVLYIVLLLVIPAMFVHKDHGRTSEAPWPPMKSRSRLVDAEFVRTTVGELLG